MGLGTAVGITASGLKVTQSATSLVSANIAGASTDGYTAKRSTTQAIYAGTGLIGFTTTVSRAFDQEVFDQLSTSTSTSSFLQAKNGYLDQINSLIGSTENGAALPTVLATFTTDLQTLAAQPSNAAAQIQASNSANVVAQTLNSLSSTVGDIQKSVDEAISDGVSQINTLTAEISDINQKIQRSSGSGSDTTGLMDQRDQAVLKLATLLDVNVKQQSDGTVRLSTGSGLTLVDNSQATQLKLDDNGRLRVDDGSNNGAEVIGSGLVASGSMAGLFEVRDTVLPQVQNQLDQIAAGLSTAMSDTTTAGTAVTSGSAKGFDLDLADLAAGNKVTLNWTDTATGQSHTVSLIKGNSSAIGSIGDDATLDPNDHVVGIDFSGGMSSVVSQIQAALGSNFAVSNTSGSTLRVLDDGTGAVSIGSASKTVSATAEKTGATALPLFTDGTGYYTGSFDGGSQMSGYASRIRLNAAVASDPSLMVNYSSTTQSGDSARPQALYSALVDTKSATVLGNGTKANQSTVAGFANSMVSYWAGQADTQQTLVDNQSVIQSNLRSRMSSTSAVDTDTELTKLIQLQNYYSANAQVLSTLRDMLNTLVNAI